MKRIDVGVPFYAVDVPARITKTIARPRSETIPVVVTLNGFEGVNATLVARGGGTRKMFLNGAVRKRVGLREGDKVVVSLVVNEAPPVERVPVDLTDALREADALDAWEKWTRAKKNHIVTWIEKAAREATRTKYIARTVELALAARDREIDREARATRRRAGARRD
jgi:hypothetical protein